VEDRAFGVQKGWHRTEQILQARGSQGSMMYGGPGESLCRLTVRPDVASQAEVGASILASNRF
jgi:hypothetical protein